MEKEVNAWLKDYFPHYRLVWGPYQLEHRLGTFVKHYPIYAEVTEIREVPKYPMVTTPCYILETKAFYEGDEIKDHNSWDIAFPFIDVNGDAAMPNLETIQFMMKELLTQPGEHTLTASDAEKADRKAFDKEVEQIEESLSE